MSDKAALILIVTGAALNSTPWSWLQFVGTVIVVAVISVLGGQILWHLIVRIQDWWAAR